MDFARDGRIAQLGAGRHCARAFPAYRFVPATGMRHPICHPEGHSFVPRAERRVRLEPLDALRPEATPAYLFGVDLYNHGYFWEAQDWWEACWRTLAQGDALERFFRGLILAAVSQLKLRTGQVDGTVSLGNRACLLLRLAGVEMGARARAGLVLGLAVEDFAEALEGYVETCCTRDEPRHAVEDFPYMRLRVGLRRFE